MTDALRDVVRHGTAVGTVGARINFPAGGKTGTTNDGADVWFIGYTADLVAGVWMGFDRPQRIKANAQGGVLAAPAWTAFMTEVYRRKPAPPDWPRPEGIIARQIDKARAQPHRRFDVRYAVQVDGRMKFDLDDFNSGIDAVIVSASLCRPGTSSCTSLTESYRSDWRANSLT